MTLAVEQDEAADPEQVLLLGAVAVMQSAEVVANPVEEAGLGVHANILPVPIDARKRRWSSTPKGLRAEQPPYVAAMRHFSGDYHRNSAPECAPKCC